MVNSSVFPVVCALAASRVPDVTMLSLDPDPDLDGFNRQLLSVMNRLAAAVIAEIKTSAAVHDDGASNGEEEGKLETLVKIKCIEASDSIMNLIRDLLSSAGDPQTVDSTSVSLRETDFTAPLSEDESPPLGPAVDLDHRYIRSTAPPPAAAGGRRDRGAAREAKTRKTKTAEDEILIAKSSRVRHVCQYCGVLFSAVVDLRDHQRHVHRVVERPYACDYCDKTFSHKPHRDRHHRLHRGERTFRCETCGKAYTTVSQLKTHRQTHADKSFICDVCGSAFYQSGHLTRHKLVHRAERPFRCDACGKGFTQAEGLRSHRATHSAERQLCPACGKSYRNLKHHMINKHAEDLPPGDARQTQKKYGCDVSGCGKKFLYPSLLKLHGKRTHGRKQRGGGLQGPRSEEPRSEEPAGGGPAGDRPFVCGVCGATFNTASNLSRHGSIHTGETPFSCSACGKRFRLLDFLKTHEKIHLKHKLKETDEALEASVS